MYTSPTFARIKRVLNSRGVGLVLWEGLMPAVNLARERKAWRRHAKPRANVAKLIAPPPPTTTATRTTVHQFHRDRPRDWACQRRTYNVIYPCAHCPTATVGCYRTATSRKGRSGPYWNRFCIRFVLSIRVFRFSDNFPVIKAQSSSCRFVVASHVILISLHGERISITLYHLRWSCYSP